MFQTTNQPFLVEHMMKGNAFKTHPLDLLVACSLSVLRVQGVDDEAFIANQPMVISCRYMEVPEIEVPPVIIHFNRILPSKPSSYGGTPIYGTPT